MVRMDLLPIALMRFAAVHGLTKVDDDGHGYALHSWLAAMFGAVAPKPFRLLSSVREGGHTVLGYVSQSHEALLDHAQAFADPLAFAALVPGTLASKPMPAAWRPGLRLRVEVLACPTSRMDSEEKEVYLRTIDRLGESAPSREQVYREWFARQVAPAVELTGMRLQGFARVKLARRSQMPEGGRRLLSMERPRALLAADATVRDGDRFADLLRRGVGRHRAFGFGMLLLRPTG
jgi:CRISPR system Cascade subunit CasE